MIINNVGKPNWLLTGGGFDYDSSNFPIDYSSPPGGWSIDYSNMPRPAPRNDHPCLIEAAWREEQKKPPHQRQNVFMISCPCPKCNPYFL